MLVLGRKSGQGMWVEGFGAFKVSKVTESGADLSIFTLAGNRYCALLTGNLVLRFPGKVMVLGRSYSVDRDHLELAMDAPKHTALVRLELCTPEQLEFLPERFYTADDT